MKIDFKVGNKYCIHDIMSLHLGELVGFVHNQTPVRWENKESYGNRQDKTTYLVLKYFSEYLKKEKFCLAIPNLSNYIHFEDSHCELDLQGIEYSDSIEGLIKKLRQNWIFTPKITYASMYKENFNPETDVDWMPEKENPCS